MARDMENKKRLDIKYRKKNKEKIKTYMRKRLDERIKFINSLKDKPCMDCGKNYHPECMELDHVSNNKFKNVSQLKLATMKKLIDEIQKCQLVCAICHRLRTISRIKSSTEKRTLKHRAMINDFKSVPCVDCELSFPPAAMELDHVRGIKSNCISNMRHHPRWKVLEELQKCEVVCACCHRIRTAARRNLVDVISSCST